MVSRRTDTPCCRRSGGLTTVRPGSGPFPGRWRCYRTEGAPSSYKPSDRCVPGIERLARKHNSHGRLGERRWRRRLRGSSCAWSPPLRSPSPAAKPDRLRPPAFPGIAAPAPGRSTVPAPRCTEVKPETDLPGSAIAVYGHPKRCCSASVHCGPPGRVAQPPYAAALCPERSHPPASKRRRAASSGCLSMK